MYLSTTARAISLLQRELHLGLFLIICVMLLCSILLILFTLHSQVLHITIDANKTTFKTPGTFLLYKQFIKVERGF